MKRYLFITNTAHGFKDSFAVAEASGFVPDGGIEIGEGYEAEDFYLLPDETLHLNETNVPARAQTSDFYHEVMRNIVKEYRRSGMYPVIIKEDGKLKVIMLGIGARDSRMLMLAPNGFEPGDEKYIKEVEGGLEIDFGAKEKDLMSKFDSPVAVQKASEWNQSSILSRMKKSFIGG